MLTQNFRNTYLDSTTRLLLGFYEGEIRCTLNSVFDNTKSGSVAKRPDREEDNCMKRNEIPIVAASNTLDRVNAAGPNDWPETIKLDFGVKHQRSVSIGTWCEPLHGPLIPNSISEYPILSNRTTVDNVACTTRETLPASILRDLAATHACMLICLQMRVAP